MFRLRSGQNKYTGANFEFSMTQQKDNNLILICYYINFSLVARTNSGRFILLIIIIVLSMSAIARTHRTCDPSPRVVFECVYIGK